MLQIEPNYAQKNAYSILQFFGYLGTRLRTPHTTTSNNIVPLHGSYGHAPAVTNCVNLDYYWSWTRAHGKRHLVMHVSWEIETFCKHFIGLFTLEIGARFVTC